MLAIDIQPRMYFDDPHAARRFADSKLTGIPNKRMVEMRVIKDLHWCCMKGDDMLYVIFRELDDNNLEHYYISFHIDPVYQEDIDEQMRSMEPKQLKGHKAKVLDILKRHEGEKMAIRQIAAKIGLEGSHRGVVSWSAKSLAAAHLIEEYGEPRHKLYSYNQPEE